MDPLEEVIRMWELFRQGVIAELENVPDEKWEYRPGAGARTLRELALHIAAAGSAFVDELIAPEPNTMRLLDPQFQAERIAALGDRRSKADVIDALKAKGGDDMKRLRENAERLRTSPMQSRAGEQSRISGIWFAAAHEMYHRGQLATYSRGIGLVPAMTQQIARRPK